MTERPILVLASNSPRRKELLALGGWPFEVIVSDVDEGLLPSERPGDYVLRLAEAKARASAARAGDPSIALRASAQIVLAADTAVVDGNAILGKPANSSDAKRMLRQLRGHIHQVYTGIAALRVHDGLVITDLCVTDVPMRNYSDAEIDAYISTGDPLDKAGAYAIQHASFQPVVSMQGCHASVMGLPLCHVTRLLAQMELTPRADVSMKCQTFLSYSCPIFAGILGTATFMSPMQAR